MNSTDPIHVVCALPERVPFLSFWEPYATLLLGKEKTIETRRFRWKHGLPGWFVLQVAAGIDGSALGGYARRIQLAQERIGSDRFFTRGKAYALVEVVNCEPHTLEHEHAVCFYAEGRFAWRLGRTLFFAEPFALQGCRSLGFVDREKVKRSI